MLSTKANKLKYPLMLTSLIGREDKLAEKWGLLCQMRLFSIAFLLHFFNCCAATETTNAKLTIIPLYGTAVDRNDTGGTSENVKKEFAPHQTPGGPLSMESC